MKTYTTPNTECQDILRGGILCHSQDGKGMMAPPDPSKGSDPTLF